MDYVITTAVILSMILVGGLVFTRKIILTIGDDNPYTNKTKENVRGSWYCIGGVIGVLIADLLFPFVKWIVLVIFGGALLWSFLISFLSTIISAVFTKGMKDYEWLTVFSSLVQSISNASVVLLVMHRGFGWI